MASTVADSATTRALSVVELLENVLINLDLKDLERSRRVSRLWNTLITTSKSFSQTRFLTPAPYLKTFHAARSAPRTWTSVFSEDPVWLDRVHGPVQLWSKVHIMVTLHPALQTAPGIAYPYNAMGFEASITPDDFEEWVKEGNWGKVLLTQPPIKEVTIAGNVFTSQTGFTMGDFSRLAKEFRQKAPVNPVGFLAVDRMRYAGKVEIKAPAIITDHSIYVRRGPGVEYDVVDRWTRRCYRDTRRDN